MLAVQLWPSQGDFLSAQLGILSALAAAETMFVLFCLPAFTPWNCQQEIRGCIFWEWWMKAVGFKAGYRPPPVCFLDTFKSRHSLCWGLLSCNSCPGQEDNPVPWEERYHGKSCSLTLSYFSALLRKAKVIPLLLALESPCRELIGAGGASAMSWVSRVWSCHVCRD